MIDDLDRVRHSKADDAELISDPEAKARREARNALLQAQHVEKLVIDCLDPERPTRIRASTILNLNRLALQGISSYAGTYRPARIEIGESAHTPPGAHKVPELVEDLCDYVNERWQSNQSIHIASYALWRLNWIHPFVDGNGRTARAVSYFVLCADLRLHLPSAGYTTIPEMITEHRDTYYRALESADEAELTKSIDLSTMENFLESLLAKQLLEFGKKAGIINIK